MLRDLDGSRLDEMAGSAGDRQLRTWKCVRQGKAYSTSAYLNDESDCCQRTDCGNRVEVGETAIQVRDEGGLDSVVTGDLQRNIWIRKIF